MYMRVRRDLVVAFTGAALFASACSSGGSPATQSSARQVTSSMPPMSSTTMASAADRARTNALAAYRGMWADFVAAGHTSDWQSSKLGQHATGVALTNMSRGLYADHYNGLVTMGEPVLNPSVSSAEPTSAPTKVVISDCGDSTHWLKHRADNGQLADKEAGGRQAINAIVEKQSDGSWKVSDFGVHDVGTC
jgi:hypothetical protein